ncbi:MAG: 50S ribosomal protein L24 [Chloroflexi bacterium]|nr:50S ribosomal protein L24 [Chloroflexota bacterium]MCY4009367.1 50S ribosomal protein L24 [Anaerolineaceae bacterium]MCY4106292.1 50S ribosomal protein L24 [Chloroflexota bacterium]
MQRIKKGDTVEIIAGKDLGLRGEVISLLKGKERVIVSGVNTMKRHEKARQRGNQQIPAQIVEFDAPIHWSNVMPVCSSCDKPVRVGFALAEGGKQRVCRRCGATLD